jgi:hypothetical protein
VVHVFVCDYLACAQAWELCATIKSCLFEPLRIVYFWKGYTYITSVQVHYESFAVTTVFFTCLRDIVILCTFYKARLVIQ